MFDSLQLHVCIHVYFIAYARIILNTQWNCEHSYIIASIDPQDDHIICSIEALSIKLFVLIYRRRMVQFFCFAQTKKKIYIGVFEKITEITFIYA